MGKAPQDIADVLNATIDRWYGTAAAFAAATGISESAISRWCRRVVVNGNVARPTMRSIEQMAPFILDDRKRPIPIETLVALAFPGKRTAVPARDVALEVRHPRAAELDRMLAEDSPIPPDKREVLDTLVNSIMAPYRTYMRRRKTG